MLPLACLILSRPALQDPDLAQVRRKPYPVTVRPLSRVAIRRLVATTGAGKDAALAFTLSAAQPVVPGQATLEADWASSSPDEMRIDFSPDYGDSYPGPNTRQAVVTLRHLTPGAQYLVMFNIDALNEGAFLSSSTDRAKKIEIPDGPNNVPLVFRAASDRELVIFAPFRTKKSKDGFTILSGVDVHRIQ